MTSMNIWLLIYNRYVKPYPMAYCCDPNMFSSKLCKSYTVVVFKDLTVLLASLTLEGVNAIGVGAKAAAYPTSKAANVYFILDD